MAEEFEEDEQVGTECWNCEGTGKAFCSCLDEGKILDNCPDCEGNPAWRGTCNVCDGSGVLGSSELLPEE